MRAAVIAVVVPLLAGCRAHHHQHSEVAAPFACTRASVHVRAADMELERALANPKDLAPLAVQFLPVPSQLRPAEAAQAICATVLSYRGAVAVVDRTLVIEETGEVLARAKALVTALSAPAQVEKQ